MWRKGVRIAWRHLCTTPKYLSHRYRRHRVTSRGPSIDNVMKLRTFFDHLPHRHAFYYWGLVLLSQNVPSPLRPWRHLWTSPSVRYKHINTVHIQTWAQKNQITSFTSDRFLCPSFVPFLLLLDKNGNCLEMGLSSCYSFKLVLFLEMGLLSHEHYFYSSTQNTCIFVDQTSREKHQILSKVSYQYD